MSISGIYVCHSKNHDFPIHIVESTYDSEALNIGLIKIGDSYGYGVINYETACEDKNLTYKEFVYKLVDDSDGNLEIMYFLRKDPIFDLIIKGIFTQTKKKKKKKKKDKRKNNKINNNLKNI